MEKNKEIVWDYIKETNNANKNHANNHTNLTINNVQVNLYGQQVINNPIEKLSKIQKWALQQLCTQPIRPKTGNELWKQSGCKFSRTTIQNFINKAKVKGWIKVYHHLGDKRDKYYVITNEGLNLNKELFE